jgi:hypothetical protein
LAAPEARLLEARLGTHAAAVLPTLPRHHLLVALEDDPPGGAPLVLTPTRVPVVS